MGVLLLGDDRCFIKNATQLRLFAIGRDHLGLDLGRNNLIGRNLFRSSLLLDLLLRDALLFLCLVILTFNYSKPKTPVATLALNIVRHLLSRAQWNIVEVEIMPKFLLFTWSPLLTHGTDESALFNSLLYIALTAPKYNKDQVCHGYDVNKEFVLCQVMFAFYENKHLCARIQ
jgi:hypothetical protein